MGKPITITAKVNFDGHPDRKVEIINQDDIIFVSGLPDLKKFAKGGGKIGTIKHHLQRLGISLLMGEDVTVEGQMLGAETTYMSGFLPQTSTETTTGNMSSRIYAGGGFGGPVAATVSGVHSLDSPQSIGIPTSVTLEDPQRGVRFRSFTRGAGCGISSDGLVFTSSVKSQRSQAVDDVVAGLKKYTPEGGSVGGNLMAMDEYCKRAWFFTGERLDQVKGAIRKLDAVPVLTPNTRNEFMRLSLGCMMYTKIFDSEEGRDILVSSVLKIDKANHFLYMRNLKELIKVGKIKNIDEVEQFTEITMNIPENQRASFLNNFDADWTKDSREEMNWKEIKTNMDKNISLIRDLSQRMMLPEKEMWDVLGYSVSYGGSVDRVFRDYLLREHRKLEAADDNKEEFQQPETFDRFWNTPYMWSTLAVQAKDSQTRLLAAKRLAEHHETEIQKRFNQKPNEEEYNISHKHMMVTLSRCKDKWVAQTLVKAILDETKGKVPDSPTSFNEQGVGIPLNWRVREKAYTTLAHSLIHCEHDTVKSVIRSALEKPVAAAGLDFKKLWDVWQKNDEFDRYYGYRSNIGVAAGISVAVIDELNQNTEGAPLHLHEKNGICVFGRDSPRALAAVYKRNTDPQRRREGFVDKNPGILHRAWIRFKGTMNGWSSHRIKRAQGIEPDTQGVLIGDRSDWNGSSFAQSEIKARERFLIGARGDIMEIDSIYGFGKALVTCAKRHGPLDYAVLHAHGSPDSMRWGAMSGFKEIRDGQHPKNWFYLEGEGVKQWVRSDQHMDNNTLSIDHIQQTNSLRTRKWKQRILKPKFTLAAISCSVGAETTDDGQPGIMRQITELVGGHEYPIDLRVLASAEPNSVKDMSFSYPDGQFKIDLTFADDEHTRVIEPGKYQTKKQART